MNYSRNYLNGLFHFRAQHLFTLNSAQFVKKCSSSLLQILWRKSRLIFLFSLYLLYGTYTSAQVNVSVEKLSPRDLVRESKVSGFSFSNENLFKTDQTQYRVDATYRNMVGNASIITLDLEQLANFRRANHASFSLRLPFTSRREIELELVEVNPFRDDFKVTTDQNSEGIDMDLGKHYRGVVKGAEGSIAAISILDDEVVGVFSTPREGNFVLGKLGTESRTQHILYRDAELKIEDHFECQTIGNEGRAYSMEELTDHSASRSSDKCVGIYYETEYDIYEAKGSVQSVVKHIASIHNQVATLYANEQINLRISEIFVWTNEDPYTQGIPGALHNFIRTRTSFNGDLAHLLTFRLGGGGVAGTNVLCHPTNNKAFTSMLRTYEEFPVYSRTVKVLAHELGHNFGSQHTHECVWNGNGTQIDDCGNKAWENLGTPLSNLPACYDNGNVILPAGGGTIMSYCDHSSLAVGTNFSKGFGMQPGTLMRNRVSDANCLQACNSTNTDLNFFTTNNDPCPNEVINFSVIDFNDEAPEIMDESGNGKNGKAINMEMLFENHPNYGKSLNFDGNGGYIELPNNITSGLTKFTFEAKYYLAQKKEYQRIFDFGSGTEKFIFLSPSEDNDKPTFWITKGSYQQKQALVSPEELQEGQWYHFAVVLDGNHGKLYIDGELKAEKTFTIGLNDLGDFDKNWLGKSQFPDPYLEGKLDEVRIWSVARTEAQIQSNKDKELTGNENGLKVYYDFNTPPSRPTYTWSFPGGTPSTSTELNPSVKYTTAGSYDVSLTLTSNGNTYASTKPDYINVGNDCIAGLSVGFTADKTESCTGESVNFTSVVTTGTNILKDHSGNEKHGALVKFSGNAYSDHPSYGKALSFDGSDDLVDLPDNLTSGLNQMTFEAKFYMTEKVSWQRIFDFNSGTDKFMFLTPISGDRKPAFWITKNGLENKQTLNGPDELQTGQWYHFVVVLDGNNNTGKLYINGELKDSQSITIDLSELGDLQNNWLGKSAFYTDRLLKGKLDEVRIWRTARTESQIQANKDRELTGVNQDLVLYYKFNQEVVTTAASYTWEIKKEGSIVFTSTDANPSFSFENPGIYHVNLTVHHASQTVSQLKEGYLRVDECNNPITVDFTADNLNPCIGEAVQFTSSITANNSEELIDHSGKGNHGTLRNFSGSPFQSHTGYGKSLQFQANQKQFIDATTTAGLPKDKEPRTIEAWIKTTMAETIPNTPFDSVGNIVSWGTSASKKRNSIAVRQGRLAFIGQNLDFKGSKKINNGAWHHVAVTFDGTKLTFYVNGELDGTFDQVDLQTVGEHLLVGKNVSGKEHGEFFDGEMDELRIWTVSRTKQQIQDNYNKELTGSETDLLVYYDFNQDLSGASYSWSVEKNAQTIFTSSDADPTFSFVDAGTYRVSLTVTANGQTGSKVKNDYITVSTCAPSWPVTKTGDNHTVIVKSNATIDLNGQAIAAGDYIGAFYHDNGMLKCAGKAQWTGQNIAVIVYGDDLTTPAKEGFGVGESFQWKIWKASSSQELYASATYDVPSGIITHMGQYGHDGVSRINRLQGTTQPPQTATQTIMLQPGWNLISSYIQANTNDMATIFDPIKSSIAVVKNAQGAVYMSNPAINSIGNWNVVQGYKVKVLGSSPVQLTLTGEKVDLARTAIPFAAGHNLFAYLKDSEQAVQTVMAPIASEVEVIKDAEGKTYIPSLGINNIGQMKPGHGYSAKMKSAVSLNYTARMATPPANMHTAQLAPSQYSIQRRGTENATLILDPKGLVAYGDEIGVFNAKGQLVGSAIYENHLLGFSIWGDDPSTDDIEGLEEGESFEIRVWNHANRTEQKMAFTADLEMYITHEVIHVELLRTTSVPTLLEANSLKLYPNPTRNNATLSLALTATASVEATIFDLSGKQVLHVQQEQMTVGSHELGLQTAQLPSGLYHCRVMIDGIIHNIPFSVVK